MIHWYRNLYMDDVVAKNPSRCKKRVEKQKIGKQYYVIILAENNENLFEIMETRQLFFRYYRSMEMYIVGLTSSYTGAVSVLQEILMEVYRKDTSFDIKKYFEKIEFN